MTTTPTPPPVTDALRAEARANPGAWVYAVDPVFEGVGEVPPQGVVGAWPSDQNGELGEFAPNPNYLPSPLARGWVRPTSSLENALQIVLAGHAPNAHLVSVFASSQVFVFSRPEGGLFLAPAQDGGQLLYAFTDAQKAAAAGYSEHIGLNGAELAKSLPEGVRIALNPGSPLSAIIEPGDVESS